MGNNLNLAVTLLLDNHIIAQVVGAPFNFDGVLQKLFKRGDVEDLVACGLLGVDDELSISVSGPSFSKTSSFAC